jgi:hypothetical protein
MGLIEYPARFATLVFIHHSLSLALTTSKYKIYCDVYVHC